METNNSRLNQKSTDNKEEEERLREAKIGIFLFILISLLFSCFYYFLETGPLFSVVVPFMIGWVISESFFGIGFGDFLRLFFEVLEALLGIGLVLMVLFFILMSLYYISTGTSIGDNFRN